MKSSSNQSSKNDPLRSFQVFHRFKITSIPLCTFFQVKILFIYSKYDCFVTENNRKCSKVSVLFRATRYAFNTQEGNYYVLENVFFFFNFYSPSDNCFMLAYNMLKNNFHCRSEKFCQVILVAQYKLPALFQNNKSKKDTFARLWPTRNTHSFVDIL